MGFAHNALAAARSVGQRPPHSVAGRLLTSLVIVFLVVGVVPLVSHGRPSKASTRATLRAALHHGAVPKPNTWSPTGPMDAGSGGPMTLLHNGQVLVISTCADGCRSAQLYTPRTGTWSLTGQMMTPQVRPTATLLPDGRVLVVGGSDPSGSPALSNAELYDPRSGRWMSTGSMNTPRWDHTATLLPDGRVLVTGGLGSNGFAISSAEVYDPHTGQWTETSPLHIDRSGHTATLLRNGKVLVVGGFNGTGQASAELYDPRTGRWTFTDAMRSAHYGHTATLLADGRVLVAGGCLNSPCPDEEVYDPRSGAWMRTGPMRTERSGHTATLLPTGQVLVAGGCCRTDYHAPLATAELYDPHTGLWTATSSMHVARWYHSATLLLTGQVLVAGGEDNDLNNPASAELYTPGAGALMDLIPSSQDFGHQPTGTASTSRPITLTNTGSAALTISSITITGPAAHDFATTTTCQRAPVAPRSSCTIRIRFIPRATGRRSGRLLVSDNAPDSPQSIPLIGIGYGVGPNTWAPTGGMLWPLSGHTAVLLHTGRVLLLGGGSQNGPTCIAPPAQLYDPRTGRWAETGGSGPPCDPAVALLPDGQVLVAGGDDEFCGTHIAFCPSLSSAGLYDPHTGAWTATGSMTTGRAGATAIVLRDGQVLVAGGVDGYGGDPSCGACTDGQPLASAELYNPRTGKWTRTGSMTMARVGHTATLLRDGRVLVAGPGASAELYDPRHGTWTATGDMTTARSGYTATLLPNGKVLVAGGQDSKGAEAELYDPRTGRWTATGNMTTARAGHTATLLPNGQVLVTGGSNSSGAALSSTELYDPGTGRWRAATPMLVARAGHTATLLPNGQVLVAGGDSRGTSEVYTP